MFWSAYPPNSNIAQVSVTYAYDALGNQTAATETMTIAGYPSLTRQIVHYTNLLGALWIMQYGDFVGGTNATTGRIYFDARGLPQKYVLLRTGMANQDIAVQTRNVAGLVTKRRTDFAGGSMPFVESNWTYDPLGRVTQQLVQEGPGPTRVAEQDLTYLGNDDISTLDHYLGASNHKQFNYTFDLRHQLQSVIETAAGGAFTATYGYSSNGRFDTANESALALPGSDVKTRNVTYVHGDADRDRVTALRNPDASVFASYGYDDAGNQLQRSYPATGDTWDYLYDGEDQLRRATKRHGATVIGSEEYWYIQGQRVATVKRDAAGNKTELIWIIGDTEAHYDGTGNLVHVYSHLSLGTPVARVDRTSNTSTTLELQFHGLASNTLAAVDQSGTVNASFDYAPFGEIIESTDAGGSSGAGIAAHRRRLNDKYVDELTDLSYYGVRFYDKTLMGWTQSDPLYRFAPEAGSSRRANLYTFSLQNPLRYMDPDGRDSARGSWTGNPTGTAWIATHYSGGGTTSPIAGVIEAFEDAKARDEAFNQWWNSLLDQLIAAAEGVVHTFDIAEAQAQIASFATQSQHFADNAVADNRTILTDDLPSTHSVVFGVNDHGEVDLSESTREGANQKASGNAVGAMIGGGAALLGAGAAAAAEAAAAGGGFAGSLGGTGAVVLDTNALVAAIQTGQAGAVAAALAGRQALVPITAAKEYLAGGSAASLRAWMTAVGARMAAPGSTAVSGMLRTQAAVAGRFLGHNDAQIAASAVREGVSVLTRDTSFRNFLNWVGIGGERF